MDSDLLRRYLEFYQDLGIQSLYRRASAAAPHKPDSRKPGAGPGPTASPALPPLAPAGESLFEILSDLGDCRRCRLYEGRSKIVFGVGNERSPLVFVGEGPGADEDAQGIPFVGRAGQLLTQMI